MSATEARWGKTVAGTLHLAVCNLRGPADARGAVTALREYELSITFPLTMER